LKKLGPRGIGLLSLLLICLVLYGCQTYYGQAISGQFEIVRLQEPFDKALEKPTATPELKAKLALVEEVLVFADREMKLPNGGNYTQYADLGRDYVLWSVFAAPEFEVEAKVWKYPVVGSLGYRGYFKEADAQAFGEKLRKQGYDVAVVGVPAYSTLGWFHDPVLNTFVKWKENDLAALIFHELTHKKYYRAGDTEFSEALAVSVEQEGVRRWLTSKGDTAGLAKWDERNGKLQRFVQRLLNTRAALDEVYKSALTEEAKRAKKAEILGALQTEVRALLKAAGKKPEDSFWMRDELNNAHLNVIAAYYLRVPEFEQVLRDCGGDMDKFFAAVKDVK